MSGTTQRRLLADRSGAAALEFALVGPVFFLLLAGIIELCLMLFINGSLQGAVASASRYGLTGQEEEEGGRLTAITQILRDRTFGMIDIDAAEITTRVYPSFGTIGKPEPFDDLDGNGTRDAGEPFTDVNGNGVWDADMGLAGLGGPGDIVLYEVSYRSRLISLLAEPVLGEITFLATVAVRNEPF